MSEDSEQRSHLPWVMAALVLTIGGAKLDAVRPYLARVLAVAIPVVPVLMGVKRLEGTGVRLERAAAAVGWITLLAGEICIGSGFFEQAGLRAFVLPARWALYGAAVAALVVHAFEARRSGRARFAAFIGMACVFAIYLSTHTGKDAFGRVFGSFFVALFVGGGAGLLLGEAVGRVAKSS